MKKKKTVGAASTRHKEIKTGSSQKKSGSTRANTESNRTNKITSVKKKK